MDTASPPPARWIRASFAVAVAACGASLLLALLAGGPTARLGWIAAAVASAAVFALLRRIVAVEDRSARYHARGDMLARAALQLERLREPEPVLATMIDLLADAFHADVAAGFRPTDAGTLAEVPSKRAPDAPRYEPVLRHTAMLEGPGLAAGAHDSDAGGTRDPSGSRRSAAVDPALRALALRAWAEARTVVSEPEQGAPSAHRLAVPVVRDGRPVAVLALRRALRFTRGDRESVEVLARLGAATQLRTEALQELERRSRDARALATTGERLLTASDEGVAIDAALRAAAETSGAGQASLLRLRGDRLHPVGQVGPAASGADPAWRGGLALDRPELVAAWHEGRTVTHDDPPDGATGFETRFGAASVVLVPVHDAAGAPLGVLVVADAARARRWSDADRAFLASLATMLGAALERLALARRLHELLSVVRTVAQANEPQEAYERAVDAAVRLLPSAEAATLLLRDGDRFRYVAAHGYDLAELRALGAFGWEEELLWYRLGRDAFERGVPRRLRGTTIGPHSAAAVRDGSQAEVLRTAGRVPDLKATVCVPIVVGREVLGTLNVDNLSRSDAFSDAELELGEAFGQQFGVIVRQAQTREALARAAVTDPVTGLGNREGFNRRLRTELARASRRGHAVHLVMMDLDGFKRINDRHGHHVGDEALRSVADALRTERRGEDGLFRWGGDEFALLLSELSAEEAATAARRYADRIAALTIAGERLGASVGIAAWPDDARDEAELLRIADDLMYRGKERVRHRPEGGVPD